MLKKCRNGIARWKSTQQTNFQKRIKELQNLLQGAYDSHSPNYNYINSLKVDLIKEYKLEEEFWRTKSRIQWLRAGDRNTKFFHEKNKAEKKL